MDHAVKTLARGRVIEGKAVVLDATFVKAYSKRDQSNNQRGYSDRDARVGRAEKGMELGYKVHVTVDVDLELPVALTVVKAN